MTGELEAAAADGFADIFRRKPKPFTQQGEPCANCGTPLEGWYCHACGQNADRHHRTILHLIWEAIEGMFHLDGRLARTLPLMFFKPGVLAKDYMEGRIARHVPPFRTFLVALLLFIFAAEHSIHNFKHHAEMEVEKKAAELSTPQGRAKEAAKMRTEAAAKRADALKEAVGDRDKTLQDVAADKATVAKTYADDVAKTQARYAQDIAQADALEKNPKAGEELLGRKDRQNRDVASQVRGLSLEDPEKLEAQASAMGARAESGEATVGAPPEAPKITLKGHARDNWFKEGLAKAIENPEYYMVVMFGWAHRMAVLLLPIIGLSLALVYINKRQYFIYDHLLVATNLLSFSFLTNAIGMVLPAPLIAPWFVILAFWTPINLFQTLRGGYGSSIVGAAFKTLIVWFMSVFAFALLLSALLLFSLSQM